MLARSSEERVQMGNQMFEVARAMILARSPGLSEIETKRRLCERLYGDEVDVEGLSHLEAQARQASVEKVRMLSAITFLRSPSIFQFIYSSRLMRNSSVEGGRPNARAAPSALNAATGSAQGVFNLFVPACATTHPNHLPVAIGNDRAPHGACRYATKSPRAR